MAASVFGLGLRVAYREDVGDEGLCEEARCHLEAASDALRMALLTLAGDDDDRGGQIRRAEQARAILAEAVTSLSRARIYVPAVRTHALPVLLDTQATPEAELTRLHNLTTRLLWLNHSLLPARRPALPMEPEEEAQLAIVLAGLARNSRIDRALRYKWAGLAAGVALGGTVLGLPVVGVLAATSAVGLTIWRAAQADRPSG